MDRRLRQRYSDIVRLSFQNIARGAGNALDIVGSAVRTSQCRVNLGQIRSKFGALADLYPLVCNWVRNLNWSTLSILVRNRQCCGVKDRCRNRECDFLIPAGILIIQSRLAIQRNLIMTRLYGLVFDLNRIRQGDCTIKAVLRIGPVDGIAGHCGVRLAHCRYLQRAIHQFDACTQRVADQTFDILADLLHAEVQLLSISCCKGISLAARNIIKFIAAEGKTNCVDLAAVFLKRAELSGGIVRPLRGRPVQLLICRIPIVTCAVGDNNHDFVGIIRSKLIKCLVNPST